MEGARSKPFQGPASSRVTLSALLELPPQRTDTPLSSITQTTFHVPARAPRGLTHTWGPRRQVHRLRNSAVALHWRVLLVCTASWKLE